MSLILEALKKSEAKRRLGEAPDLGTPFAAPRRRNSALPLLFIAIIACGAFGWWYLRKPAPATDHTAVADTSKPKTAAPQLAAVSAPAPRVITPAPPPAPAPAARVPPSMPSNKPAPESEAGEASKWVAVGGSNARGRGALQAGRKLPPNMHRVAPAMPAATKAPPVTAAASQVAAATPQPAPAAKTPEVHAASTAAPATSVLAKAAKTPEMHGVAPAPELRAAKSEPTESSTAAPVVKNDVPFYYELPFNVRKTLPPLRLSMHVYAGDPKQRFVILNDSRLAEGDKTSDEITLREVRKDGAVLEFQGQRFFFPRDM
jgi:cytoskeletal protein RodZ